MTDFSIAEAKLQFAQLARRAEGGQPLRITRRSRAVAVLLSEADFARLSAPREGLLACTQALPAEASAIHPYSFGSTFAAADRHDMLNFLPVADWLGVSFGRNSALRTYFGLNRLPKHGIHPSLPARTIGPKGCQDVWIDPKCNGFFRRKFGLSSNSAKLCDSGGRTTAVGDDSLPPVDACWGHRWRCGRKRGSNLVLAKEARSSL